MESGEEIREVKMAVKILPKKQKKLVDKNVILVNMKRFTQWGEREREVLCIQIG